MDHQITEHSTALAGINNILDHNYSDYFLTLNDNSTVEVGPDREYFVSLRWVF